MRKVRSKAVKLVLWTVLFGGMAGLAGTSTIVLAQNRVQPLFVCSGVCGTPYTTCPKYPNSCYCGINNYCMANTP
jgi:hypothetical protein